MLWSVAIEWWIYVLFALLLVPRMQSPRAARSFRRSLGLILLLGLGLLALSGLMSDRGEIGLARAAARMGVPCTAATSALTPMEEIYAAAGGNLWFQLYMWVDVTQRMKFVERVKAVLRRATSISVG